MKNKSLIYCIKNKVNNKVYVGQTISFRKRFNRHRSQLNRNENKPNKHLQFAWNKYGEENFEFIILEYIEDPNKLTDKEDEWVELLDSKSPEYGYNKADPVKGWLGLKHSEETKEKLSKINSGKNNPNYGKPKSLESKIKASKALKGREFSEETRLKMSISRKKYLGSLI